MKKKGNAPLSILVMTGKRKKRPGFLPGPALILTLLLMFAAACLPGPVLAASVFDVVKETAAANSRIKEGFDMGTSEYPIADGSMISSYAGGNLNTGEKWAAAWFTVIEPAGNTSISRVIEHLAADLDADANMKVIPMDGYEMREITYDDYSWGLPKDDIEVWIILARHVIQVDISETGYDKAANLKMGRNMALQLKGGLEKAGLTGVTGAGTAPAVPAPVGAPPPAPAATGTALDEPVKVSDTMNIAGVYNGATVPTTFSLSSPHLVTYISTYHWNNARGTPGGTIALRGSDGKVYGPWQVTTRSGQGGVPNAYWVVEPNIVVPAGTYTVVDSDPATWSQNSQSGGRGMGEVRATPHYKTTGAPAGGLTPSPQKGQAPYPPGHQEPFAGVGSAGSIPGPSNTTEAVTGVVVPGLIAIALGAMGGLGGGGLNPPGGGNSLYPTGGGPLNGAGGSPETGGGTAGMARATGQIGRRGKEDILIDTVDVFETPGEVRTAGEGAIIDTADEAGVFVRPVSDIFIDPAAEAGIIIDTLPNEGLGNESGRLVDGPEEEAIFVSFDPGLNQDIAAETGAAPAAAKDLADGTGAGIFIDTSALEDKAAAGLDTAGAEGDPGLGAAPGAGETTGLGEEGSYDREGYDARGFDVDGFDREGFDKEGFDKDGFDAKGFDKEGFDKDGFDAEGFDKEGFDKEGFDAKGFDKEGFDKEGFDAKGFDKEGFDKEGFDAKGFDKEGFDKEGFDAKGFDKEGFDKEGFDAKGFDKEGFDKEGFDAKGFDKEGFDKNGFDAKGFDKEGFDKKGFDAKGFDKAGFDNRGYDREGFNKEGFDKDGFGRNGFDSEGFDRQGYDVNGYDRRGFNRSGFDAKGYDKQGFDKEGFNRDGWDREGYDRQGFDRNGWDRDGFDKDGYDAQGYDRDGYNREGQSQQGYDADGYDQKGFNEHGYDRDGYDREGFNYEGYNRSGRDPWGYDKQGYGKDGYHWSGYNADGYNRSGRHWSENPYEGASPFNVSTEGNAKVHRNPFDGGKVIIEQDNYGNKVDLAGTWKPTKPPLGEPYPKTVEKFGAKPWDEEVLAPRPEKATVPTPEGSGVIGPEDPMNTLDKHDPGAETSVSGAQAPHRPIPEEDIPVGGDGTGPDLETPTAAPPVTGPRHGDTITLPGKDGRDYPLEYNGETGEWENILTGGKVRDEDLDSYIKDFNRWQDQVADDQSWSAAELEKMANRQDANSMAIDAAMGKWKQLEQMQKAADKYAIGTPGGPGDVDKAIQDLKDDMLAGREVDDGRMEQLKNIIKNRIEGKTSGDSGLRKEEDWIDTMGYALEANLATAKEVATGQTEDGSISWKGMAAKLIITTATGGVPGKILNVGLTAAEALSQMKDEFDKGGSDFRIVSRAMGTYILGEQMGWLAGKGMGALNKSMLERFPVFTNKAADFIEKALLKGSALNQQLSRKLGLISKESAESALNQINRRLIDIGGDQAAGRLAKQAAARQGIAAGAKTASTGARAAGKTAGAAGKTTQAVGKTTQAAGKTTQAAGKTTQAAGKTTQAVKPAGKPSLKTVSAETPGLKIDNRSFKEAGLPPDLRGMPVRDQKAIRSVCDRYGVKAHMRPTNPDSRAWLDSGRAHPKPEMIKSKTINQLDVELGYPKENIGTVGCRRPDPLPATKPAAMTDAHWTNLQKRHAQRMTEFTDQAAKLQHLEKKGIIVWDQKTGIIYNKQTMKPYCGDHDTFAIVDAVSGKPVSPRMNEQINRELQSLGATQHPEHVGWDYSGLSDQVPDGSVPGAQSPREIAEAIDRKILSGHGEGGEALNTYDPLRGEEGGWTTNWWQGGVRE